MRRGPAKQFDTEAALARAMEVFWARGYEGASLAELQAEMGIGRKSLYDTYGNKRTLFLKALEHYMTTEVAAVHSRLLAAGSPLANLRAHLQRFRDFHACGKSKGCLVGVSIADFDTGDPEMAAVLGAYLDQIVAVYAEVFRRAQAAGELPAHLDPVALGKLLLCLTQGGALVARVAADGRWLDGALPALVALLAE